MVRLFIEPIEIQTKRIKNLKKAVIFTDLCSHLARHSAYKHTKLDTSLRILFLQAIVPTPHLYDHQGRKRDHPYKRKIYQNR